jgi:hypothetical protein
MDFPMSYEDEFESPAMHIPHNNWNASSGLNGGGDDEEM